jgi:hypothetical protein
LRIDQEKLRNHDDEVVGSETKAAEVTLKVPGLPSDSAMSER